ncbi:hypothetical protein [Streptomyces sp. NPDC046985]|uniref:hypothetical protein n=1 Tax=Streptomyces sp. NPDC046985 TaxID=3155377 RepID=UPI003410DB1B
MLSTEDPEFNVMVTFSVAEHTAIVEHAAELDVPVEAYIHQAATRRARDGQTNCELLEQAAAGAASGAPAAVSLLDDL